MNTQLLDEAKEHVRLVLSNIDSQCHYHNTEHTLMVYRSTIELANLTTLSEGDKEALYLSALFHDVGFIQGADKHEERSAQMAEEWLTIKNYDPLQKEKVKRLILSTKMSVSPKGTMEAILNDADLSHLASKDYLRISENLRNEKEERIGQKLSKSEWLKININFFKEHQFASSEGQKVFGPGKERNLKELIDIRNQRKRRKAAKKAADKATSISESKAANTQFKTALRNHIDLSAIADNKANMMLSVNALILTISIPALGIQIGENPNMLLPFAALLITCMLSIIFATLATKPIVMSGTTDFADVKDRNANLFFFGNFYKMTRSKYQEGIQYVIENEDSLDSSIIKDLFDLGRALGGKYRYLSICYSIFMYGLIITSSSFLAILLYNHFAT
jgi:HD superfamily phosphodiesterase